MTRYLKKAVMLAVVAAALAAPQAAEAYLFRKVLPSSELIGKGVTDVTGPTELRFHADGRFEWHGGPARLRNGTWSRNWSDQVCVTYRNIMFECYALAEYKGMLILEQTKINHIYVKRVTRLRPL
jgi:hypothetical protein